MKVRDYIGDRAFFKEAMNVALPLMFQQVVMSSVNLIDNLMVGQLGDAAIGGVGVVNRFWMIALFAVNGFIGAAAIYISQFNGAKDNEHLKQSFRFSLIGSLGLMVVFACIALFFTTPVVHFFAKDPEYILQGTMYMKVVAYSFVPAAITSAIANGMRTLGETKVPLVANIVAVITNCAFNYVLIFGHFGFPTLGVRGAAIATLISRILECLLLIFFVKRKQYAFSSSLRYIFRIEEKIMEHITIKALPLVINEILWSGGQAMLLKLYATRGDNILTAYSVMGTITDIFFSLFGGMAVATAVMIGQRLGANKLEEARKTSHYLISFSLMLSVVFGGLIILSSFFIPNLYDLEPATKAITVTLIRVCGVCFWIYMINAEIYFILRAGGDTKHTLMMDSGFMWVFNIPLIALLSYKTGLNIYMIYIAGQMTDIIKMIVCSHFYRKGHWITNLTIDG